MFLFMLDTKGGENNGIFPWKWQYDIQRFSLQDSEPAGLNSIKDYVIPDVQSEGEEKG